MWSRKFDHDVLKVNTLNAFTLSKNINRAKLTVKKHSKKKTNKQTHAYTQLLYRSKNKTP